MLTEIDQLAKRKFDKLRLRAMKIRFHQGSLVLFWREREKKTEREREINSRKSLLSGSHHFAVVKKVNNFFCAAANYANDFPHDWNWIKYRLESWRKCYRNHKFAFRLRVHVCVCVCVWVRSWKEDGFNTFSEICIH